MLMLLPRCCKFVAVGLAALAMAACSAAPVHLQQNALDLVFVDGVQLPPSLTTDREVPLPYYGTAAWTAQPCDLPPTPARSERPDWSRQAASGWLELPPPAPAYLFPLDLPLELVARLLDPSTPPTFHLALPETPPEQRVARDVLPAGLDAVSQRAQQARASR